MTDTGSAAGVLSASYYTLACGKAQFIVIKYEKRNQKF